MYNVHNVSASPGLEIEEKPFTSSLNICPKSLLVERGERVGGVMPPYFPADLTAILLLSVSFMSLVHIQKEFISDLNHFFVKEIRPVIE
jgi:hypothetical protein